MRKMRRDADVHNRRVVAIMVRREYQRAKRAGYARELARVEARYLLADLIHLYECSRLEERAALTTRPFLLVNGYLTFEEMRS